MKILVINCGSSSLKYQLIDMDNESIVAKGLCERIGIDGRLTYQPAGGEKNVSEKAMPTHTEAIQFVIDALTDADTGVVKSLDEIGAVGHRVVHGGEKFASSDVITEEVKKAIEECNDLAPLHNRKLDRYYSLRKTYAEYTYDSCIRYGVPSDNAGKGLYVCYSI